MAKQDSNQEPSIEEILDSIRQIISDDEEQAADAPAAAPASQEEVIELTERAPSTNSADIEVDLQDEEPAPAAAPPPPKPEPVKAEPAPAPKKAEPTIAYEETEISTILTKNAEDSVMGAFTELTKRANVEHGDGITVEDIVREELKPLIKQWLDKHLPSMVERLLQKEMERISKRVLGDE